MKTKLKYILIILLKISYAIVCLPITLFIVFWGSMMTITGLFERDYQIIFYFIFSALALWGLWTPYYIKTKIIIKLGIVILALTYLYFSFQLPVIHRAIKASICFEDSICAEGLETNTQYGKIIINKENCLKYNYTWDEKSSTCDLRYKPEK